MNLVFQNFDIIPLICNKTGLAREHGILAKGDNLFAESRKGHAGHAQSEGSAYPKPFQTSIYWLISLSPIVYQKHGDHLTDEPALIKGMALSDHPGFLIIR